MAQGWDSYFPNLPPRSPNPRSFRRTTESGRPPSHHIGNYIGHHEFSGTVGSREVPVPNTNFNPNFCRNTSFESPRPDCAYNRYYDRQWQGDRQQMGRDYPQRCRNRDYPNYASNQFPPSGSYHLSFAPDFHHTKHDRDMRPPSYRGNYSAINNCSDTDAREARPSCKFTRNNFFPRPKTDIVTNESSSKYSYPTVGSTNSQSERLYPNISETKSFSVKGYREHNHSSSTSTSSNITTKENEYDENEDACHYQKQNINMDEHLTEGAFSDFHMTEKCPGDGNHHHLAEKEDELLKSIDDQDTVVNDIELVKSQVLESLWEKSGSLDKELYDEKKSLTPNSASCEDGLMETDQDEGGIHKDTSQLLVLHESSSSDGNDDEQSESISSSNNPDFEFSLQLHETQSGESIGGLSDDHPSDSNTGADITQEQLKDDEFVNAAEGEKSTFSLDINCCRPTDHRDQSSEEMSDQKDFVSTAKSKMLPKELDCINPTAINDINLQHSADNNYKQDLTNAASCLQPSYTGTDTNPIVEMEDKCPPEKTTSVSQEDCVLNATVGGFSGDESHKCSQSHQVSLLKQNYSDPNLLAVVENRIPLLKFPNSQSEDSFPTVTSGNKSVDTNDVVSNSEFPSSGTDLHSDQEMRSPLDKEVSNSPSSQENIPSATHEATFNDNGNFTIPSEPFQPNVLNTDLLDSESTDATSLTHPKQITSELKTDYNTKSHFTDLKHSLQPNAELSEEKLGSQAENKNPTFYTDPHHSVNETFTTQQTECDEKFIEDAKDSFKELDLSSSEPGLMYGEPLSGDESTCGEAETYGVSYRLQETPETRPEKQLESPAPQLISSEHLRPFLHPVVILMNMESTSDKSNAYNCADCLHRANSVDHLIEHHYCCNPMPSYQYCKTCNVYLMENEQNDKHRCCPISQQKRKNVGPYKCYRCGLLFSRILQYIRHTRDHTGRTPFKCSGCGVYFSQSSALNHHRRVPGRCKQFLAAKKSDNFTLKDQIRNTSFESLSQCYVRLVDISKTNICNFCGKSFSSKKKTKKHIYNVHKRKQNLDLLSCQNETSALYKCPLCPRHFKYSYNRARHLRFCVRDAIYGGKKKIGDKYVCPLCKASFTGTSSRYRHIKITCLRETLNRLARERRLRQRSRNEKEQELQSKETMLITQEEEEEEATKQTLQGSTMPTLQYKCNHCPAIFFHPSGKYRHMKKHEMYKRTGKIIRYRKSAVAKPAPSGDTTNEEDINHLGTTKECPKPALTCHFCGLCFNVLASLKRHERNHRGERPYRCLECRKGFKKRSHLLGHRVVHQKSIQCTVCRKILPSIGELFQHRSSHLKKGLLQCPECPTQFQYPAYLLRHLSKHKKKVNTKESEEGICMNPQQPLETVMVKNRAKLLQCSLCRETFDDAHILRKHSLTHISESSNQCPFCKKEFTSRHSLIRHMVKHTGDKPFFCVNCGRQFYRSKSLKVHSETCLTLKSSQPLDVNPNNLKKLGYLCTICPRRFSKRIRLEMHLKAHQRKSLQLCEPCGQYYGINMISRHKLVCINGKEIASPDRLTNSSFKSNSTQVNHISKTPSNCNADKMLTLKCPHCTKTFRYKSLLLRHITTHTGVQPFRCMRCNQGFRSTSLCTKHETFCGGSKTVQPKVRMNADATIASQKLPPEGEAELKCKFCTKTFAKARSLRHHILTHNEVKPYRCKACDSCFSRYDHLKVHQALCKSKKTRLEVRIPKISLDDIGKGWQSNVNLKSFSDEQESFDCKVCLKIFPTENKLSRHTTMFHTVKKFKCSRCDAAFSHEKTLKQHRRLKKCRKPKNKTCTPLQKPNPPSENIAKQLDGIRKKILVRIQPLFNKDLKFVCSYCPRAFKNSWQLNVHTRLHTGERPYSCKHCGEKFLRSDYLLRHYPKCKVLTQTNNALCDRCGGFFSEKELENHKQICSLRSASPTISKSKQLSSQTPLKGFSCAYCSSRFLLFSQLQEHFLTTHKLDTEIPPLSTAPLQQLLSSIPKIKAEPVDESYGKTSSNTDNMLPKPDSSDQLVCQTCNMCFTNKAGLVGHQRAHATQTPYICKNCNRGFWNKTQLRNHYRKCRKGVQPLDVPKTTNTKISQTNVLCKEEPVEKSTKTSYENQDCKSNSSAERKTVQYQCSECDKSFTDGLLLISHLEDHGREEQEKISNKCSKCGRMFSNPGNLRRHMKLHMSHQRYFCSFCSRVFNTVSELEKHQDLYHSNQFSCKLCEQQCASRVALCEHYTGVHADEIFHCQWCSKLYASKKSLHRHYKKWHPKEMRDMRSVQLQRASADQQSSSYVSTHGDSDEDRNLDSDSDSAPYFPCHVCGKTFPTSESLEDHQLCHLGKKPHECAECGKCFFQASQLQQHQRMHKSEFQCQTCGRGFVTLFALRNHKHSHGKSRPFRCSKCHLGFAGPTQLAEHMSTHREESFPCDICNKIFQCKSSRAEHRKVHSGLSEFATPSVAKAESEQPKMAFGFSSEFKYRCGICSERFRDPEELSEHGCLEATERPYSCTECKKHFLHASHLKKHQVTHQPSLFDREYPCNQCSRSFSSSQKFLNHLKTHVSTATGIDQEQDPSDGLICPVCHQCFASATELIYHFPVHHDSAPKKEKADCNSSEDEFEEPELLEPTAPAEYECDQCSGIFLGKDALCNHHCTLQDGEGTNTYSDVGDASPSHEDAWDEEEVDITGEDLYKCTECLMQFSSKSGLLDHQNSQHYNHWKEFKCETCGKVFAKKRYLRKHELRQHGPKQHTSTTANLAKTFKCIQCRARFYTAQDLSNHMRLHAEKQVGEYRCDMCYKSFSKRALLKQHQESHVGEVVYECTECDKAFAFPHLLEEHQHSHAASPE